MRLLCALSVFLVATLAGLVQGQTDCSTSVIDIAFIIDGSGSICDADRSFDGDTCNNWESIQTFINDLIGGLTVSANDARIALVAFANDGVLLADLSAATSNAEAVNLVNTLLTYPGGNTNTYEGLQVAFNSVFCDGCPGNRPDVQNVAIVVTDGLPTRNTDLTLTGASNLQSVAQVYSLGITESVDATTLRNIATGDVENTDWFQSADFDQLTGIVEGLLEVACAATPAPPTTGCSTSVIDLAFVVDSSGSICDNDPNNDPAVPGCPNWDLILSFISSAADQLTISQSDAHVALVTFANAGITQWNLAEYTDKASLKQAIENQPYLGGNTATYDGLLKLETEVFNNQNGDRPGVTDVAIVITDGVPTINPDLTDDQAQRLQDQGVLMFAVGVTNRVSVSTLEYLSSQPRLENENWFAAPEFSDLQAVLASLLAVACVTGTPPPPPPPGCANRADVLFIVDASGSIGDPNFNTMREAIKNMVNELDIDGGFVRIAIIRFSDNAEILAGLTQFSSRNEVLAFLDSMAYIRGTTNTASALDLAVSSVFTAGNDRADAPNYGVIFTDGGSNDKRRTIASAIAAKRFMNIVTVGIGGWTDTYELRAIASNPDSINYWAVDRFDNLLQDTFVTRLRNFLCNNINECNSSPCLNGGTCVDLSERFMCQCPINFGGDRCQYPCRNPSDVVFAIDASGSIGKRNFQTVISFAKNVVQQLPVGAGVQVGMLTYGDNSEKYFDLRDYNSMEGTLNAMTIPYFSGGTTNTAGALNFFRNTMFTSAAGDTGNPNVGVLITDGRSNDEAQTWAEARADRANGIDLVAVGVGNARMSELRSIASYPPEENVFMVNNFDGLDDIVDMVRESVCNAFDECNPNPCINNGQCVDLRNGFYCVCRDGFTGINCERRCAGELDVLYIVDRSGSIRRERFDDVKDMIANTVNELETWNDKVRVAAVSFSDDATVEFELDTYNQKQDIMEAIRRIGYTGGRTNIASALELARTQIYQQVNGDRQDVNNLVVIFTDGGSNIRDTQTIPQAILSKIFGMQIIVAAVGRDLNMLELRGIASDPFNNNIFSVDSFSRITELKDSIVGGTCNNIDECASSPCRFGGTCIDQYYSYACVCTTGRTGQNCERTCGNRQYDLLFILDLSGSVNEVYDLSITFIKEIIYGLDFRFGNTRVALISFSDGASIDFDLQTYQDQRDVLTALAFRRSGGRTNTQEALRLADQQIFNTNNGDRNGVDNKIILLTDGGSNIQDQNTIPNAQQLRNRNVEITVVGIGDQIDMSEINSIATNQGEPFVYRVSTSEQATSAANRKLDDFCQ